MFFIIWLTLSTVFFLEIECTLDNFKINRPDDRLNSYMKGIINGYFVETNRRVKVRVIEGQDVWFSVMNLGEFKFKLSNVNDIRKISVPPAYGKIGVSSYDPEAAYINLCENIWDCSLTYLASVNPTSKMMFISKNIDSNLVETVFVRAWKKYKILNLILVDTFNEVFFLYNPFKYEVTSYNITTDFDFATYRKNRLKNLHKYKMRVNVFEMYTFCHVYENFTFGLMCGEIISTMERVMNVTTEYIEPLTGRTFGAAYPNGTFVGALKEMEEDRADVSVTIRAYGFWYNASQLTMMAPLTKTQFVYIVPIEFYPPKIKILPHEFFDVITCTLTAISLVVILFLTYFFIRITENTPNVGLAVVGITYFAIMCNVNANVLNGPQNHMFRIMASVVLITFLIMNSSYQGLIITALNVKSGHNINTMKDLLTNNLTIYTPVNLERIVHGLSELPKDTIPRQIYDKSIISDIESRPQAKIVATQRNAALMIPDWYYKAYETTYLNRKTGKSLIHKVHEVPFEYYTSIVSTRNSPYFEIFNDIMYRLAASGLSNHQLDVAKMELELRYIRIVKDGNLEEETVKLISMDELWLLFMYWGILMGVWMVVFILELMLYYIVPYLRDVWKRLRK